MNDFKFNEFTIRNIGKSAIVDFEAISNDGSYILKDTLLLYESELEYANNNFDNLKDYIRSRIKIKVLIV